MTSVLTQTVYCWVLDSDRDSRMASADPPGRHLAGGVRLAESTSATLGPRFASCVGFFFPGGCHLLSGCSHLNRFCSVLLRRCAGMCSVSGNYDQG